MMKSIYLLILLLTFHSYAFAQNFSIGVGISPGITSKNIDNIIGFEIDAGYQFNELFKIRINGGGYIGDFEIKSPGRDKESYYLGYVEAQFLYYPIITFVKPYAGVGLGYYIPHNTIPGNGNHFAGELTNTTDLNNGTGANFTAGFETITSGLVSFNFEIKYILLKSEFSAEVIGPPNIYHDKIEADLNMLVLRMGIRFNL